MRHGGWGTAARACVVVLVVIATVTIGIGGRVLAPSAPSAAPDPSGARASVIGAAALTSDGGAAGRRSTVRVAGRELPAYRLERDTPRVRVAPARYRAVRIAAPMVRRALAGTPDAAAVQAGATPSRLAVPGPDGRTHVFAVAEDSVLEPALQARHPELRTYAGREVGRPGVTARFDVTPMGFHAVVRDPSARGSWQIDPATNTRGETTHLAYYRSAVPAAATPLREPGPVAGATSADTPALRTTAGAAVVRRTYRLALLTDPAYAAYFGTENVLAEKVTLINRVNEIYNDDFAIKLVLVDGTEKLNLDTPAKFSGANGPCGASPCFRSSSEPVSEGCTDKLLTRNDFVLGQLIGDDEFDIGHIGLGVDGGGLAGVGVVGESDRAEGCTGLTTPDGDFYAVDYVAHEMGHQFGANHTFNGTQGACAGGNRNAATSVEPGSGSSVMAYAGICGQDDLQPHTDPYFSQRTITEVTARALSAATTYSERQSIALTGFDTSGERITLSYPGASPVSLTFGSTYTATGIADAVATLTGRRPSVTGYDGGTIASGTGFTLDFASAARGVDLQRVTVSSASTGVSGSTGVLRNGGPGTNGGTAETTANHAPSVTAPADATLPIRTPFTLTGSGGDVDGDPLVYLWEQNDVGSTNGIALSSNSKTRGPLFRVFGTPADVSDADALTYHSPGENQASTSPSRTFPDLAQVIAGSTNAATGSCPTVSGTSALTGAVRDCYSEFLPTSAYTTPLHFRLTARDRSPLGGGTQSDDVTLTVGSAGPLLVTSQATSGTTIPGGTTQTITWDVNGTSAAAYAPQVRLLLSTDGGLTFPTVLADATPNDGSQAVTIPGIATSRARIMVQAVGNYFFAVNSADFAIDASVRVGAIADRTVQYDDPLGGTRDVVVTRDSGPGSALSATVSGLPGLTVTAGAASGSQRTFTLGGVADAPPGTYQVTLTATDGTDTGSGTFQVVVRAEDATARYTGPTTAAGDSPVPITLAAVIGQPDDGSPGDLTTARVSFVDRQTGTVLCSGTPDGAGDVSCAASLAHSGTISRTRVGVVVGGSFLRDDTADDATVAAGPAGSDFTAPETTLSSSDVVDGGFSLAASTTFTVGSDADTASVACTLDGASVDCSDGTIGLMGLRPGTHLLTATATDASGNVDPTPATVRWAVAQRSSALTRTTGGWTRVRDRRAYGGAVLATARADRRLGLAVRNATRIALVVTKLPKGGTIEVRLGSRRLGVVSTAGSAVARRVIVVLPALAAPASGTLVLTTRTGRTVRVEGVGVLTG
ncbi:M12 family metallo-peptidase [Nocardioides fonticola]|uniref:M12 family metallo-peptidase n=1 Tax=Nocardioides fonticola TaxID=450363 RepID=UPI0031D61CAB